MNEVLYKHNKVLYKHNTSSSFYFSTAYRKIAYFQYTSVKIKIKYY